MRKLIRFWRNSQVGYRLGTLCAGICSCIVAATPVAGQTASLEDLTSQGQIAYSAGRYSEAETAFKAAIELERKSKEQKLPLAESLSNLAYVYQGERKFADAEALYRQALSIIEQETGSDSVQTTVAQNNLGSIYFDERKFSESEAILNQSLAITEAKSGPGNPGVAETLDLLAAIYKTRGQYTNAESYLDRSLRVREQAFGGEAPEVASNLTALGEIYRIEGRYGPAERLFLRALNIREITMGPEDPSQAEILNDLALVYMAQGNYADAEARLSRSQAIDLKFYGSDDFRLAIPFCNLAELYRSEGKYAKSEPLYQRSIALRESKFGPDDPALAGCLNNFGLLLQSEGKFFDAEEYFLRVLAMKTVGPNDPLLALSLNSIGALYREEGRYGEAEVMIRKAMGLIQSDLGSEYSGLASPINNYALLCDAEGRFQQAEGLFQTAITLLKKGFGPNNPNLAETMANLADMYRRIGRYPEAERLYNQSLTILEKALGPAHPTLAIYLNGLGDLSFEEGKYDDAESLFRRSLQIAQDSLGPNHSQVGLILGDLGAINEKRGKYEEAETFFRKSLVIQERALGAEHLAVAGRTLDLANLFRLTGNSKQAEVYFDRTISIHSKQFRNLFLYMTEKERLAFLNTIQLLFPYYYSFCLDQGNQNPQLIAKMYNVLLWQKGLVGRSITATFAKVADSKDHETQSLLKEMIAKKSQLASLLLSRTADPEEQGLLATSLIEQTNEIERTLLQRSRVFASEEEMDKATWEDVRNQLKPGEAAVELLRFPYHDGKTWTGDSYYVALVVTPQTNSGPTLVRMGHAKDLEKTPLLQYMNLTSEKPLRAPPSDLAYRSFWRPIEDSLGGSKRVYISTDGILNTISFPVIPTGDGRRLIDRYDIRPLASTKDLLRKIPASNAKTAVLIGDPRFDLTETEQRVAATKSPGVTDSSLIPVTGGNSRRSQELRKGLQLTPLPATRLEIATISTLLQRQNWHVESYLGENAVEEVIQNVIGPQILHVATHGYFLADQTSTVQGETLKTLPGFEDPMLRSGLFFAGANRSLQGQEQPKDLDDGILTAYEATGLHLQGTELVVLSACDTGLGQIENGEGVFGLRRAFQEAGAQSVLMSLWAVPDRETQELMTFFYTKWLSGKNKQQSLHEAQQELRAIVKARYGDDKPFYWGGFVLVGL